MYGFLSFDWFFVATNARIVKLINVNDPVCKSLGCYYGIRISSLIIFLIGGHSCIRGINLKISFNPYCNYAR